MSSEDDAYQLNRFVEAQEPVFGQVCAELRAGRKQSHWMWFIFPQIAGLGSSAMSRTYAIAGLDEARAYLKHDVLGPRLVECTKLVDISGRPVEQIFGSPDDMKFRSSMTLFAAAAPGPSIYQEAIDRHFNGQLDEATLARI